MLTDEDLKEEFAKYCAICAKKGFQGTYNGFTTEIYLKSLRELHARLDKQEPRITSLEGVVKEIWNLTAVFAGMTGGMLFGLLILILLGKL